MDTLTKSQDKARRPSVFAGKYHTRGNSASERRSREIANAEALQGLLVYLKHLYSEGEITDAAYKTLSKQALNTFIRNSIYFRVEHLFEDVELALEEVSEIILTSVFT